MTQIDFYTRVPNKLQTTCVLCAKALARNMQVMILTPDPETTDRLDQLLWSSPPIAFVPHVRARHRLAAVTPVILDHEIEGVQRDELLINLCPEAPPVFSRFRRLIEIVGTDENDVVAGRQRYRFYRDRGYELRAHDLGRASGSD
jgi:DNA polymerase-3 subunit chi